LLRREVLSNIEIIRSATPFGAQVTRMEGLLGTPRCCSDVTLSRSDRFHFARSEGRLT
jgi:hypothetical protein